MNAFDKIIGYQSIKNEFAILADMMRNGDKYARLGVTMPRGLLLYGEPGVGKTLMANCLVEASGRKAYTLRKRLCAAADGQPCELGATEGDALPFALYPYDLLVAYRLWAALCLASGEEDDGPIVVDFFHSHLAMNDTQELAYFVRQFAQFGRQVFFVHSEDQCAGIDKLCDRTIRIVDYRDAWD